MIVTSANPSTKATILVVDDSKESLRFLTTMLKDHGYNVRAMLSGQMALDSLHMDKPDIILLDVNMPEMDGYEVCRRIKNDPTTQSIPVIFISALDEVVNKVEAFNVGGVDYITKPFHVEEVLARIQNQLTILRAREELRTSEERFRLMAENARDIIFRYRFAHPRGFEYVSPSVVHILGYTPEEYYADPDLDLKLLHPESLPQFGVWMNAADSYRETIIMRYISKDRKDVWIEQNHSIITDENEKPIAIEGISRDITERKRTEQALNAAYDNMKVLTARLQDELAMARRIQQNLLSPPQPNWAGLDVLCYSAPASEVGGDLYTYHTFETTSEDTFQYRYVLTVGDVSGKGMPAALLMAITLGLIVSVVEQVLAPRELLIHLDDALIEHTRTTRQYCALVYADITCVVPCDEAGSLRSDTHATVRLANAGCISPLIKYYDGRVEWVEVGGMPLGADLDIDKEYIDVTLSLACGDMIVLVSDGIIEATNTEGEMFGFERMEACIRTSSATSAEALVRCLCNAVNDFMGNKEPHDDITIVVAQV